MAETPEQTWTALLAQLILEPESKLDLEHNFNSIFGAWAKPSTGGFGKIEEVLEAPAFALKLKSCELRRRHKDGPLSGRTA